MGRWAQRRHGSSAGSGAGPALIEITLAHQNTDFEVKLTYNQNVDATMFDPTDFQSSPSGELAGSIVNDDSNSVLLSFVGSTSGDDEIEYSGFAPNVLRPQQVQYS